MTMNQEMLSQLVRLKNRIAKHFTASDWMNLAALTGNIDRVEAHPRLLRSLRFGDEDYEGHVLSVLSEMVHAGSDHLTVIQDYLDSKYPDTEGGENVSSQEVPGRRIYFTPSVFQVPEETVNKTLVSVMMAFEPAFSSVYAAIKLACEDAGFACERADNVWEHSVIVQDIFTLIFRSYIVVCDFTGKNANVFYEAGIAHTLGKHVIPITQSDGDIPFDLRHHRYLKYLPNKEGRSVLRTELTKRLNTLDSREHIDPP